MGCCDGGGGKVDGGGGVGYCESALSVCYDDRVWGGRRGGLGREDWGTNLQGAAAAAGRAVPSPLLEDGVYYFHPPPSKLSLLATRHQMAAAAALALWIKLAAGGDPGCFVRKRRVMIVWGEGEAGNVLLPSGEAEGYSRATMSTEQCAAFTAYFSVAAAAATDAVHPSFYVL